MNNTDLVYNKSYTDPCVPLKPDVSRDRGGVLITPIRGGVSY